MKLSKRERLLVTLLIVVAVFCGMFMLIRYAADRLSVAEDALMELQDQKAQVDSAIASLPVLYVKQDDYTADNNRLRGMIYPLSPGYHNDLLVSGMALACGLTLNQLEIGELTNVPPVDYQSEVEEASTEEVVGGMIWQRQLSLEVEGSAANAQKLLDQLSANPAIVVKDFTLGMNDNTNNNAGLFVFNAELTVYMCY